jgi:hypothetical protein
VVDAVHWGGGAPTPDRPEVAGPVVYLGSAANTGITGQVIPVNAGGT